MNVYKQLRINKGLKVVEASKQLNISASYLWLIEGNKRKPGRDLIIRMCSVYECCLDDIFLSNNYTKCIS